MQPDARLITYKGILMSVIGKPESTGHMHRRMLVQCTVLCTARSRSFSVLGWDADYMQNAGLRLTVSECPVTSSLQDILLVNT